MEKVWTTKEGKKIKYEDLEDSHLNNIIRLLTCAIKQQESEIYSLYGFSSTLGGYGALDCMEGEINRAEYDLDEIRVIRNELIEERSRRKPSS